MSDHTDELRDLRTQAERLRERVDAAEAAANVRSSRSQVVQIYNAGAMPNAAGLFYAAHPCDVKPGKREGDLAAILAKEESILVRVIQGVPKAGDILIAHTTDYRWEAETNGTDSGTTVTAKICVSVGNCDGSPAHGRIINWTGPNGFTASCTTAGTTTVSVCCIDVTKTGVYTASLAGQTHSITITHSGTFFVQFFCLAPGHTTYCITVSDCTLRSRAGVMVDFGADIGVTNAQGTVCFCGGIAGGFATIHAAETGYLPINITLPPRTECSSFNHFPVNLAASLAPGYICSSCFPGPGGGLPENQHSPYIPPTQLTDSLCGAAFRVGINHWVINGPPCGLVEYFLGCNPTGDGSGQLALLIRSGFLTIGFGTAGVWTQLPTAPFFAVFNIPGPPARTITISQ